MSRGFFMSEFLLFLKGYGCLLRKKPAFKTEACAAVGHSVHMPPCFKIGGAYAPPVSMPPLKFEIVCFCPC